MSFPRYERYKDSGVEWLGEVPEHWQVQPLYSLGFEREEPNTGMVEENLLSLSYGRIIRKDIETSEGLLPDSFETYQIVCPDDIIFRLTDLQNDKRSLRTAIVRERGIITFAYSAFAPTRIGADYLNYLLRDYDLRKIFYSMGGGVRQSMKFADIKRLPVLNPPIEDQVRIRAFLDNETAKIDALIDEQRRLIELLMEKRQAVISDAVTKGINPDVQMKDSRIDWVGDVPHHWTVVPVAYRYDVQLGKMLDTLKITGENLRPYLRVVDVQWDSINVDDLPLMDFDEYARCKFRLRAGDLLINEGGSYPGRTAIWSSDLECYYQKALHRLRPRAAETDHPRYFFYLMFWALHTGVFTAGGNEATIEHLPAEKLRRYRFAFPPYKEQSDIAEFLDEQTSQFNSLISAAQRAVDLFQERRSALISAAVTGNIDVRNYTPKEAA